MKRQKERARQEKQREKAERKQQRKLEDKTGGVDDDLGVNPTIPDDELGGDTFGAPPED